jgi:hypothetical protein
MLKSRLKSKTISKKRKRKNVSNVSKPEKKIKSHEKTYLTMSKSRFILKKKKEREYYVLKLEKQKTCC